MKNKKLLGFGIGLLACFSIASFIHTKVSSQTPTPTQPHTRFVTQALDTTLNEITTHYAELNIGVAVTDLGSGQEYTYGEKAAYYGASTTKILVAAMYMHEAEAGKRKLADKVNGTSASHQIALMIEQSDNQAWTALKDALGRGNLNTYGASIGLSTFNAQDNLISPHDMAKLLQKLYSGKLINASDTQQLLRYMKKSVRNYISPALPSSAIVYHKAGWLDDRLMDTGIIIHGDKKYVLVIFCKSVMGDIDYSEGSNVMTDIVKAVDGAVQTQ